MMQDLRLILIIVGAIASDINHCWRDRHNRFTGTWFLDQP